MPLVAGNLPLRDGNFPLWTANFPFRGALIPLGDPKLSVQAVNLPLEEASLPIDRANLAGRGSVLSPAAGAPTGVQGSAAGILDLSAQPQWAAPASGDGRLAGGVLTAVRPGKRDARSAAIVAAPGALALAAPLKAW